MKHLTSLAKWLTLPIIILGISYIFLMASDQMSPIGETIIRYAPYVLLSIAMILSSWFNKSRIFFVTIILTVSLIVLSSVVDLNGWSSIQEESIGVWIALLIPLNIIFFSLLKERGIWTFWGKMRICFIILQILIIAFISSYEGEQQLPYIFENTSLLVTVSYVAATTILIGLYVFKQSYLSYSLIGVLLAVLCTYTFSDNYLTVPLFFSAAAFILIITVIQVSYSMAYLDELTGIPARRALKEEMMKLGNQYTIAMLDIDFFKKFNDKYGHDVGDDVLKLVATNLTKVAGGGKAFRYGGEEFTILFPNKNISEVLPYLEELRKKVANDGYSYYGKNKSSSYTEKIRKKSVPLRKLFVTISIGVAEKNDRYKEVDQVLKAADKALYRAKKKGRNCVSK